MSEEWVTSKADLLAKIHAGWDDIIAYLDTLTPQQRTALTDAAGWTVKDHVMHMAVWEDGINALLDKQPRHIHMGLDDATWNSRDFDRMNAVIQQKHRAVPWDAVMETFHAAHQRLLVKIETLSDADLMRPYRDYQAHSEDESVVIDRVAGNTFAHYAEHKPWIAAIVAGG